VTTPLEGLKAALADRYLIERELGQGGMATVYLALDLKHKRKVALKIVRPELAQVLGTGRFLREIEIAASLRHPHILPLYDSGDAAGMLFYVMPLVEGETLRGRLDREKQLQLDEALRYTREIADALAYAHAQGVVHRDIKPENILLESGHAVVADFGIARAAASAAGTPTSMTGTGVALGTPAYMSPEQAAGQRDLDGRSDLYSLACMLFEMLAGLPPFSGATAEGILRQHVMATPPPVTQYRAVVPPAVAEALARALLKNPADRFGSITAFAAALEPGQTGSATAAFFPTLDRTGHRIRLTLLAVGILAVLGGGWLAFGRRSGSSGAAPGASAVDRPQSIAVLPFVNIRGDSASEYFSDGVTEEILNALAQLPNLRVTARTSSFQFKGKEVDVREVGRRLDVGAVLEGSVQRSGETVRITAQLVDARTGYHLWSGKFDRPMANLFAVEDEISRTIADTLKVSLGLTARPARSVTDPRAHDLYLRGLSLIVQRGASLRPAIQCFDSALARDSTFAPAWAGRAVAYELLGAYYLVSWDDALTQAERSARRALALDSTVVLAHTALASVHRDRQEWAEADQEYRRALFLAPNDPETIEQYGQFLLWVGQTATSLPWLERARRLDPLAPIPTAVVGVALNDLGRFDSARVMLQHSSELGPTLVLPQMRLMWAEINLRNFDLAETAARRGAELGGLDPKPYVALIRGIADPRLRPQALAALAAVPDTVAWELNAAVRMNWYALLGDTAAALRAVERVPGMSGYAVLYLWNPALEPIRKNPRFQAVLRRLRLPYHGTG
jgi:serine/threonine-protein kinase